LISVSDFKTLYTNFLNFERITGLGINHPFWSSVFNNLNLKSVSLLKSNDETYIFTSNTPSVQTTVDTVLFDSEEVSSSFRAQKNQSPVFKPDFKSGNFFTRDDFNRRPHMLTTISDLSKGMRKPV